jgi:hypothetical protein
MVFFLYAGETVYADPVRKTVFKDSIKKTGVTRGA